MYIPKRKVVCAMITEIDFKVKGEERKKLAYAIGELFGMQVKYTRTPKFDYLIWSCILDKNGGKRKIFPRIAHLKILCHN